MGMAMARPTAPTYGRLSSFRRRIPRALLGAARDQPFTFTLPGENGGPDIPVTAQERQGEIAFSLRTRDPAMVKRRHAAALDQFDRQMQSLADPPLELAHRDRIALAGEIYKAFVSALEREPVLSGDEWRQIADATKAGREDPGSLQIPLDDGSPPPPFLAPLEARLGRIVNFFLGSEGLRLSDRSRTALLIDVAREMETNARLLGRYADGDYSPDQRAPQFPAWVPPAPAARATGAITFPALCDMWVTQTKPAASTAGTYRSYWSDLQKFVGHNSPAAVSEADVIRWKDSLVERGASPKSSHLPAVRSIFAFAAANRSRTGVASNPAAGVRMPPLRRRAGGRQ